MLIKKSKLTFLSMAAASIFAIASCNNESAKTEEPAADTTKTEAPAPAPADSSSAPADTTKVDTATTRPIKNPG